MFRVVFSKNAEKHKKLLKQSSLDVKARNLIDIVRRDPFQTPPPYEKLIGDFKGAYSRRINHQHRFVYTVDETDKIVRILSMWTHYE